MDSLIVILLVVTLCTQCVCLALSFATLRQMGSRGSGAQGGARHFRFFQDRRSFNVIGAEIVRGCIAGDTVHAILRTGTFGDEFVHALRRFRGLDNTKFVVITPDSEVFLSNCEEGVVGLVSEIYENRSCDGVRGLLLTPRDLKQRSSRMRGYLFLSDGHVHMEDEGFYANSEGSAQCLAGYLSFLAGSGREVNPGERT